jgi:hypothetical protein
MKAISIRQPWLTLIATGAKTIETRTWKTSYRGDILLCASKSADKKHVEAIRLVYVDNEGYAPVFLNMRGMAVCIAELYDIQPMTLEHEEEACCDIYECAYSWFLRNIRPVKPFIVDGKLSLFDVQVDF